MNGWSYIGDIKMSITSSMGSFLHFYIAPLNGLIAHVWTAMPGNVLIACSAGKLFFFLDGH